MATTTPHVYDGEGDTLMQEGHAADRVILLPDSPLSKVPDPARRLRIMWGQHLLDDLLAGRYRSLVCAVNPVDNSHGIISQLASLLPTSQWSSATITDYAERFASSRGVTVLKFDMDALEVLTLVRNRDREHLSMSDLADGFKIVAEMIRRKPESRLPSAAVSFLGAQANALVDENGDEPSFETVLRAMHEAGYSGDVYPPPHMWEVAPTAVYPRYPFPSSIDSMREGGH